MIEKQVETEYITLPSKNYKGITRPGHTDLGKKYYFFFAPIWKAPEYVLNLRQQLIRTIFKHAGDPPKLGLL